MIALGTDHAETAMSFLSLALWVLGRPDQALAMQKGALTHSEWLEHLHTIAQALTYMCFLRVLRREPDAVIDTATRLIQLADEHGFPLMAATGRFWRGWAMADAGALEEGVAQMEDAATAWWATGAQTYRSFAETLMAEARMRAGDFDGAGHLLIQADERIKASDERWAEPELLRLQGELQLARSPSAAETAAALFRAAAECAERQGAIMWQLRATTSLARVLRTRGRTTEIEGLMTPLLQRVTEGGDTRDLKEARELLITGE
jgi:predicted ATPase